MQQRFYNFDRKKRFLGSDSYVNNNPSTPRRKMQIHFNHDGNISEIILTEGEKWKTTKPVLFEVYGKKTGEDNILLHKFKYNKQSNFTEWTCTDNHKNLEFEVKINYDKQGRLIQEKKIDKYSTVEKTISYDYSNQNIIKTINEYDETTRFKYDKSTDSWIPLEAKSKTE